MLAPRCAACFSQRAASRLDCAPADHSMEDGAVLCHGKPTGQDYWSLADTVDLTGPATASAASKSANDYRLVGRNASRVDLAAKVFGAPVFIHDMKLDGMVHARVVRQPRPGRHGRQTQSGRDPPCRQRGGQNHPPRQLHRHPWCRRNRPSMPLPLSRPDMLPGTGSIRSTRCRRRRGGCSNSRPSINRLARRCRMTRCGPITRRPSVGCTSPTPRLGHPAGWRSIATANCGCGHIARAFYPLRAALARTLKINPAAISVKHVQGPGCYGHNGADDAAADAAEIAFLKPGTPIRGALAARVKNSVSNR